MSAGAGSLAVLYRECYGELVGYLTPLLGQRAEAEDVAQEAGMKLIALQSQADTLRNPRAFLFHVATNLARDQLRRRVVRERAAIDLADSGSEPGADVVAGVREDIEQARRMIHELPERPRQVLLLARVEGYSHAEIAERLGIAPKTVENHLTRALQLLTARLRREPAVD